MEVVELSLYAERVQRSPTMNCSRPSARASLGGVPRRRYAPIAELRGDAEATLELVARRAEVEAGESMLQFIAQGHLGVAEWLHGRLAEAENVLSTSMHEWRAAGHRNLIGWGCYHLGQVERALGRLDAAWETYEETLRITAERGRPTLPAAGIAYAGLAEVAYQRNELDAALWHVTAGIPLCRQFSFTPPLATALATLAWARQAAGDTVGALAAMADAMRAAPGPAVGDLLNPVPAQQARLLLVQGDVEAAESWTISRGLQHGDEPDYPRELGYLCWRYCLRKIGPTTAAAATAAYGGRGAGTGPAASSRFRRCWRSRSQPMAMAPRPWTPWPRHSSSVTLRATCVSLPMRAHRCGPSSAGWSQPNGPHGPPHALSRSITWLGSCALSTSARPIRAADARPPRLRRAWSRR